uniref:Uncharacterized protein n=1 Tax=viral metagenome TaxID=1070528 RepID=A0A6C0C7L4_9ZZZZ
MEDNYIYHNLKSILKNKLIINLKKDEDFKDLNIDDLIEERLNKILDGNINFNNINKINNKPQVNNEMYFIKESMRLNKLIKFHDVNPKSKGLAHDRYNRYKNATTYREFIDLGGEKIDYYNDYRRGYLKIL